MSLSLEKQAHEVTTKELGAPDIQTVKTIEYTPEEEKAVLRKIDTHVLPLLMLVFFTQYIDKQILSYTVIFGLKTDLKLTGNEYSWLTSGFYLAQLISQFVYAFLLSKFPIKFVTGSCIFLWAISCMCLGAPHNFAGMVTVRCFLGMFEGAVSPAFVIVTANYYKKSEHALRTCCWISCNAIAQIVGTFLVYGIGKGEKHLSIASWRVSFIVCGALTVIAGIMFIVFVPFSVGKSYFLTEREKAIAIRRILSDSNAGENDTWDWDQAKECITDAGFWFSFFSGFLVTVTSQPITFSSLIITEMGYTSQKTLLYGSPSGAVQFVMIWVGALAVYLMPRQRIVIISILVLVPLAGNVMLYTMRFKVSWAVIVGSWLGSCITSFYAIVLSLISSNIRGNTKKSIVSNAFYVGYALAVVIAPQWWNYSVDPHYTSGLIADLAFWGVFEILIYAYRFKCIHENKKRDKMARAGEMPEFFNEDTGELTDVKNLHHRYSY